MIEQGVIKVLVADDVPDNLDNIVRLFSFDKDFIVVAKAVNGREAVELASIHRPDVVLMDVNMPVMDGVEAACHISSQVEGVVVVMMSVQSEAEYLRSAMAAGARDYLVKPFGADQLIATIKKALRFEASRRKPACKQDESVGKLISVYSSKGGVGKTTLAVNMAVALAQKGVETALADLDIQFGDVSIMLDIIPRRSLMDIALAGDSLTSDLLLSSFELYKQPGLRTPIRVLPAPSKPEQAEYVKVNHVEGILNLFRQLSPITIIDTSQTLDDITLTALDMSDEIIIVTTLDIPTIKNVRLSLEIMSSLGYDSEKIKIIVNRANVEGGVTIGEIEKTLGYKVYGKMPSDGAIVVPAANQGRPFLLDHPQAKISTAVFQISDNIMNRRVPKTRDLKSGEPGKSGHNLSISSLFSPFVRHSPLRRPNS